MTAPAWMPLYVAEYLADTGHLSTLEHGAYMLLIMHYWQNDGLPTEDPKLARIARLSVKEWLNIKETIADLFLPDWRHKRVEVELSEAVEIIGKKSKAGRAGGLASAAKRRKQKPTTVELSGNDRSTAATANVNTLPKPTPTSTLRSEVNSAPNGAASSNPETDLFRRGKAVLGKDAGGLIKNVLKAKDGNVALARAAIETASTKENPREYLGAIARNKDPPGRSDMDGIL